MITTSEQARYLRCRLHGLITARRQKAAGWPNLRKARLAHDFKRQAKDAGLTGPQAELAWRAYEHIEPHELVQFDLVRWLEQFQAELTEAQRAERRMRILARCGR
jgi:hypothetical protein